MGMYLHRVCNARVEGHVRRRGTTGIPDIRGFCTQKALITIPRAIETHGAGQDTGFCNPWYRHTWNDMDDEGQDVVNGPLSD